MRGKKESLKFTLTGVPNVGKSTLFNTLTGLNVHTGNWSGKTVETSLGEFRCGKVDFTVEDLPGAYSLAPRSEEEAVALESLLFSEYDVCVIVCDESRFYSNLNFILWALDSVRHAVLCLNFCESAEKGGAKIDEKLLSEKLGVEVVRVNARKKRTLTALTDAVLRAAECERKKPVCTLSAAIEESVGKIVNSGEKFNTLPIFSRIVAIRALSGDADIARRFCTASGASEPQTREFLSTVDEECKHLFTLGLSASDVSDSIAEDVCKEAEKLYRSLGTGCCEITKMPLSDRILTGKALAYPAMLLLLGAVLFITVKLASYPSAWLESVLGVLNLKIKELLFGIGTPRAAVGVICDGALGTLFTVTAVMLPPMAIFFPFFTLLEDSGYLPRVAYNLDRPFAACGACGKQSLTMCMGLGCNAVGVTGARIIDTRRERLLAILTNSLVPCNGRFPMLMVISTVFLSASGIGAAGFLLIFVVLSFAVTLGVTFILSRTVLRGEGGFFTIELPPYRRPDIFHTLVRSLFDRTLKILARAAAVAIPAGVVIWCLSNISVGGTYPITVIVDFLDPVGRFLGLDGVMLTAFILGLPANETVLPIALSLYGKGASTGEILALGGWTLKTAVAAVIFTLFHWPCSTTIITVKRETGSIRWTLLSVLVPTAVGVLLCAAVNLIF